MIMKKVMIYMMLLASFTLTTGCSSEDDEAEETWDETQTQEGEISSSLDDNNVTIVWDGDDATVSLASNISSLVTATIKGGHVCILASSDLEEEVTYTLSGSSSNGSLYMDGDYKATFVFDGLSLTSNRTDSAAVNIRDGKRIAIVLNDGTTNTLADRSDGSHNGCMMVNGHTEFEGGGSLTLSGYTKHAFWGDEYVLFKSSTGTITVQEAETDGFNVNQYFQMEGGTLVIKNIGDDGIAVAATDDSSDDQNGEVILNGGTATISVTGTAAKGIKCDGDMTISGGTYDITTTGGGEWDSDDNDTKGSSCLKSDGNITITGGTTTLKSSGSGGKGLKADGKLTISDGTLTAQVTGSNYTYGNYSTSAKAIKSDGAITISGGTITASASSHEAIESKSTIDITGGSVSATSKDDAINAASHFTISGGYVMGYSTGNDGLDANGNFYMKGGTVYAIGAGSPEVAIDANTEGGYKLYVNGGTLVAISGLEQGSTLSQACYSTSSWSKNTWYALYNDGSLVLCFKAPSSGGSGLVVSTSGTPTLQSGVSVSGGTEYFDGMGNVGGSVSGGSSVSLSSYSGGTGGMGGGSGPGGGGRW